MKQRIVAIVAILALMLTGCAVAKTDAAHQGLHYKAGPLSATKFANCYGPSIRHMYGPGDKNHYYPAGQRTYSFTGLSGSESKPVAVTDKNGQSIAIPGYVTFTLTSNCSLLEQFDQRIGIKYGAYTDKGQGSDTPQGWTNMLNDYMATPLQQALNKAAQTVSGGWQSLYTNTAAQDQFEGDVKATLPQLVSSAMGGNYFTINQVSISKPEIPDGLKQAIESKQEAEQENAAQKAKNQKILTQYDTIKSCLRTGLSESSCTLIFLEQQNSNIPFIPVPQGGSINYQGGSTK